MKGLGFRKLNAMRDAEDTPAIRGMVAKVPHLVRILEQINLCQASTLSGRIPVRRTRQNESAAVPVAATERRRLAAIRACGPVRAAARSADLKADRCRCIAACRSADSPTLPFKKKFSTINVSDLAKFEKGSKVGPQELVDCGSRPQNCKARFARSRRRCSRSSAARFRALLHGKRAGENHEGGRHRRGNKPVIEALQNIFNVPDLRKRILVHARAAGRVPHWRVYSDARNRFRGACEFLHAESKAPFSVFWTCSPAEISGA